MCKRGDIVALEQYHTASYVGGQHTQHVEFTLATATSVSRDGAVKAVRLAGFPYDRNSKFQAHKVAHMFRTKVLTISPEHQRNAARVCGDDLTASPVFATADELRSAILSA